MGNVDSISPFGNLFKYLPQFFNVITRVCCNKTPVDITFFGRVLKPDKLKGRFKGEIFENFHTTTVQ